MLTPREEFAFVALGAVFLFIGVAACCLAAIRGKHSRAVLVWFGLFSGLYGIRLLAAVPAAFSLLVGSFSSYGGQVVWMVTYVIMIPALLFWAELTRGGLRRFFLVMLLPVCLVAVGGTYAILSHQPPARFMAYNNVLVISALIALTLANIFPWNGERYLLVRNRVSVAGVLTLAVAVIHDNLSGVFPHLRAHPFLEPLAFAAFLLSQGLIAAEKVSTDQRRLISIEDELAIARDIQTSILPSKLPEFSRLRISAAYCPVTAVAGDFYWIIAIDPHRAGFLVADVSGHGVPAALIASMIKVAMQSVTACADDPAAVLRGVNRALTDQPCNQLVSAAYLWLDSENGKALYSAAGHPPLLRWSRGRLGSVQSNGLVFGVLPNGDYPVSEMTFAAGDRFLLYTDGLTESENAKGEAFGDRRLEEVLHECQFRSCSELSERLMSEVRRWRPGSAAQQDDITLIVIDVLQKECAGPEPFESSASSSSPRVAAPMK